MIKEIKTYLYNSVEMEHEDWHKQLLLDLEHKLTEEKVFNTETRAAIISSALCVGITFGESKYTINQALLFDTPEELLSNLDPEDLYDEISKLSNKDLKNVLLKLNMCKEQDGKILCEGYHLGF